MSRSGTWYKERFREYCKVVWEQARIDRIPEFVHPECSYDDLIIPGQLRTGFKALEEAIKINHENIKDLRTTQPLIIEEDGVITGWGEMAGIAVGPMFPPDLRGETFKVWFSGKIQFEGDLITHVWNFSSLQQAGARLLLGQREKL